MLRAGVAIRDITPGCKLRMGGYPDPADRSGLMAHDPMYSSVYYFENDTTRMVFITSDIISMTKDRCNELRMLIEKHTGIPRENVCVACTHTHSGPIAGGNEWDHFDDVREINPENNDRIRDLMLSAVKEAVANAFDAKIGWGVGTCGKEQGVGGNRHDPENGPCDPSVSVLAIKDRKGELRGCMVNYSLHPTVLHAENFFYTADYPGYIRQTMNQVYPFMIFGFQLGSSGNQSTRFFRQGQDFKEAERIGGAIGREALRVLENMSYVTEAKLGCASAFAQPPVKDFPSHEETVRILESSRKAWQDLVDAKAPYKEIRAAESIMEGSVFMEGFTGSLGNATVEDILKRQTPIECQAMRIGDCCIVGIGCEHFVEIGQAVKDNSGFAVTMIASLSNGSTTGYVTADEAHDRFCYEAQCSTFTKGGEKILVDAALKAVAGTK